MCVDGHLNCFHILDFMINAAVNICGFSKSLSNHYLLNMIYLLKIISKFDCYSCDTDKLFFKGRNWNSERDQWLSSRIG